VDFEVVVVGSGAAGLAAALEAAACGATVLVAEAERATGGSSRLSGSWIQAAGTSVQRAAGIDDSPAAMLHDYLSVNRWRVAPGLARVLCEDASEVVEWLRRLGVTFGPLQRAGAEPVARGHRAIGEGAALIDTLERACVEAGVEIALGNRVDDLIVQDGRVAGVRALGNSLTASAVVLATGGFARNRALLDQLIGGPWLADATAGVRTFAGAGSRGDGIEIATRIGAAIAGEGRALWVPEPLTPAAVLLVRPDGRRFVDESADFTTVAQAAAEFGAVHYAIFDERGRQSPRVAAIELTTAGFLFNDGPARLDQAPLDEWVREGDLVMAGTVGEVADGLGLDRVAVGASVAGYNQACVAGIDRHFEKPAASLLAIAEPPFYGVRIQPRVLIATFCGLQIDEDARVLDRAERPIPGLYAAGETAGGVVGDVYAGHGNSITSSLVFGRLAGRNAAGLAQADPPPASST
jgi:fumarate reductase flavoprotein subunit